MTSSSSALLTRYCSWLGAAILVLLPFHALLTTWLGSNFGQLDLWRIWKELLITAMLVPVLTLVLKDQKFRSWFKNNWLPKLLLIYFLLNLVLGLAALAYDRVNTSALIYSFLSNLRFLGFFAIVAWLAYFSKQLSANWWKILLIPAAVVVGFGLIQLALPHDFLTYFGYGSDTIPAYQTIDQKLSYQRIQSTLRGANPLGAYLVLVVTALILMPTKQKVLKAGAIIAGLTVLFFSYSRSAWLGLVISLVCILAIKYKKQFNKHWPRLVAATAIVLVLGAFGLIKTNNDDQVQNVLFHTNEKSQSAESSNTGRVRSLQVAAKEVLLNPLGSGPGTAGPASTRNNHPPKIAENYFLQIGQETGWLGIGLFIAINMHLAKALFINRADKRAALLLCVLGGLTIVNMASHAWADDTLGLVFWGFAGIVYGDVILNKKRKSYEAKSKPA